MKEQLFAETFFNMKQKRVRDKPMLHVAVMSTPEENLTTYLLLETKQFFYLFNVEFSLESATSLSFRSSKSFHKNVCKSIND